MSLGAPKRHRRYPICWSGRLQVLLVRLTSATTLVAKKISGHGSEQARLDVAAWSNACCPPDTLRGAPAVAESLSAVEVLAERLHLPQVRLAHVRAWPQLDSERGRRTCARLATRLYSCKQARRDRLPPSLPHMARRTTKVRGEAGPPCRHCHPRRRHQNSPKPRPAKAAEARRSC